VKRLFLAVLLGLAPTLVSAVPTFIPYAGRLTDGAGPATGTATLLVKLYDSASDETPWFAGKHPDVPIVDGYFSLNIGQRDSGGNEKAIPAESALDAALPAALWLTVVPEGADVEPERKPVGSVPYAVRADTSAQAEVAAELGADATAELRLHALRALCAVRTGSGAGTVVAMTAGKNADAACLSVGKTCEGLVYAPSQTTTHAAWTSKRRIAAVRPWGLPVGSRAAHTETGGRDDGAFVCSSSPLANSRVWFTHLHPLRRSADGRRGARDRDGGASC
jgi:hypothetical protein